MTSETQIRDWVEEAMFIDTHEHLIEESDRIDGLKYGKNGLMPCDDWAYLFFHYLSDDLVSAGMTKNDLNRFLSPDAALDEKLKLVLPWWERAKHTGYGQSVRHTLQGLYQETDLTPESAPRLAEKYRAMIQPGFYRHILHEKSRIERCQINSLQCIFKETEQPDLLQQDIGFPALSSDLNFEAVEQQFGRRSSDLDEWLEIIDWVFTTYEHRAVAAKNQSAYGRRLNYSKVDKSSASPLFNRKAAGESLSLEEEKTLQDYLFRYCVERATEQRLPVKLHTGYYAGHNYMPLERVRQNAADLCPLLNDFPDTTFVLMHIGYTYQDEAIALAKHYHNVTIDLCWAWIINPMATVRFVKEYLLAAPANKLFTFGGDYITVETIYGHSRIARQGLTQALSELVDEGWIAIEETKELVVRLMRGNALETFPVRD